MFLDSIVTLLNLPKLSNQLNEAINAKDEKTVNDLFVELNKSLNKLKLSFANTPPGDRVKRLIQEANDVQFKINDGRVTFDDFRNISSSLKSALAFIFNTLFKLYEVTLDPTPDRVIESSD